ncbi:MAG: hypothetical protein ACI9JN_000515 [Bacteroidia bacterium]|jgi:hypothetical protein
MPKICYIILVLLLSSCVAKSTDKTISATTSETFVVETIEYIDSLYNITPDEFFQLKQHDNWDQFSDLIYVCNNQPISIFTYGKFGFLEFKGCKAT